MKNMIVLILLCWQSGYAKELCSSNGKPWSSHYLPNIGTITCCKGLVAASKWQFEQSKTKCLDLDNGPDGDSGYCVTCGDGKCDKTHYESQCNCPKDCQ